MVGGWGFMDIRVLEYYLIVAREESITKAAAILHVTQPTLSRQLMQLEEELQVKLFNRTSHSVVLTARACLRRTAWFTGTFLTRS